MSRAAAPVAFASCALACALLSACAAPGDPTPRHPVVPAAVSDLAARQFGSAVALTFSLPQQSMDRQALAEPPTIEIYRAALVPGATPDRKSPWRLAYTIPSERVDSYTREKRIEFNDPLTPDDLSRAPGLPLAYMVRTREVKVRASGDSNYFMVRIYPPPAAPGDVHISIAETAMIVSWTEPSGAGTSPATSGYRVYRAEIEPREESVAEDMSKVKLRTPATPEGILTSTEWSDTDFEFGHTYLFTVRAVAEFGQDLVESGDSSPVVVTPQDIFPPAAPVGLEAAIVPATLQAPPYVELSWAISPEGDMAGYHVYRSDREDTPGERINHEMLPSPTFRDISVSPGRRYFYRVSAVDRAGNESPLSPAVQAEVP